MGPSRSKSWSRSRSIMCHVDGLKGITIDKVRSALFWEEL